MSQTRMPAGKYKKRLLRLPPDILTILEQEAAKEERSFNGQLVHTLRVGLAEQLSKAELGELVGLGDITDQARQRREGEA